MKPKKIVPMIIAYIAMALATITLHSIGTLSTKHALVNMSIVYIMAIAIVTQEARRV